MIHRIGIALLVAGLCGPGALASSSDRAFEEAKVYLGRGEADRAAAVLQDALRDHPEDARLHFVLGQAFRKTKPARLRDALEEFQTARRLDPSYSEAHVSLKFMLILSGRLQEAEQALRDWLASEPDHPLALTELGAFLQAEGQTDEGTALLERAAEIAPRDESVWLAVGRGRLWSGDVAGAVSALERARDLGPKSATARYKLAQAYAAAGRDDEASSELIAYEDLQRGREERLAEERNRDGLGEAIWVMEEAFRKEPDQPVEAYAELVSRYRQGGNLDDARAFLTTLAEKHTDLAAPLVALALLSRRDAPAQAWTWLRQARERDPYLLAVLRVQIGLATTGERRAEMREILDGLDGDPKAPPEVPHLRARLAIEARDFGAAEAILSEVMEKRPGERDLTRMLAQVYSQSGRRVQALTLLQELTDAHPDDGSAWFQLALVERSMGLAEPMAEHLERAVEAGEESPQALNMLAVVLARRGERARAIDLLERSLEIDSNRSRSRQLLQSLKASDP